MAPLDIPFHWKQIQEKLENIHQEGDEDSDIASTVSEEEASDSEDWSEEIDSEDWSEELIVIIPDDDDSEMDTDADSIEFLLLTEEETSTPLLPDLPDARRRLFEVSSGDEDDDDGVAYLSD